MKLTVSCFLSYKNKWWAQSKGNKTSYRLQINYKYIFIYNVNVYKYYNYMYIIYLLHLLIK